MERRPVTSSNVASIGWEPLERDAAVGTLEVEFHSGHVYSYEDVPESEYQHLVGAGSVGRYFNAFISGQFTESRIK